MRASVCFSGAQTTPRKTFAGLVAATFVCVSLLFRAHGAPAKVSFEHIGQWPGFQRGAPLAIHTDGHFLYCLTESGNLLVLDIANEQKPVVVGQYFSAGSLRMRATGNRLFLVGIEGLEIVEVSAEGQPKSVGRFPTMFGIGDVALEFNYAYVTNPFFGFAVLDVSDPANIREVGRMSQPVFLEFILGLDFRRAYVTTGRGFCAIDLTFTSNPTLDSTRQSLIPTDAGVLTFGSGYLLQWQQFQEGQPIQPSLQVFDLRSPWTESFIRFLPLPERGNDATLAGLQLYIADGAAGLVVVDVSKPSEANIVGRFQTAGSATCVGVQGNRAFVGELGGGLEIIDITDPRNPSLVSAFDCAGVALDVVVRGSLAYLADRDAGLRILDVTDPSHPNLISRTLGSPTNAIFGDQVHVQNSVACIGQNIPQLIDVANIGAPVLLSIIPRAVDDFAFQGDVAYTATASLECWDLTNKTNPALLAGFNSPASGLLVRNRKIYSAGWAGLNVYDAIDPFHPTFESSLEGSFGRGIACASDVICVSDGFNMQVVDVSDPRSLKRLGAVPGTNNYGSIKMMGNLAISREPSGFTIYDLIDPMNPVLLTNLVSPGKFRHGRIAAEPYGFDVSGNLIYIPDGDLGLSVVKVHAPARIRASFPKAGSRHPLAEPLRVEWRADGVANPDWEITFMRPDGPSIAITGAIAFDQEGSWTVNWQLPADSVAGKDYRIRIRDAKTGAEATTSSFELEPRIEVFLNGGSILIRWVATAGQLQLYQTATLGASWNLVNSPTRTENGWIIVDAPLSSSSSFYQLQNP